MKTFTAKKTFRSRSILLLLESLHLDWKTVIPNIFCFSQVQTFTRLSTTGTLLENSLCLKWRFLERSTSYCLIVRYRQLKKPNLSYDNLSLSSEILESFTPWTSTWTSCHFGKHLWQRLRARSIFSCFYLATGNGTLCYSNWAFQNIKGRSVYNENNISLPHSTFFGFPLESLAFPFEDYLLGEIRIVSIEINWNCFRNQCQVIILRKC